MIALISAAFPEDAAGLKLCYGSCRGWTQMLCCLNAHLKYKINLRHGFYQ